MPNVCWILCAHSVCTGEEGKRAFLACTTHSHEKRRRRLRYKGKAGYRKKGEENTSSISLHSSPLLFYLRSLLGNVSQAAFPTYLSIDEKKREEVRKDFSLESRCKSHPLPPSFNRSLVCCFKPSSRPFPLTRSFPALLPLAAAAAPASTLLHQKPLMRLRLKLESAR